MTASHDTDFLATGPFSAPRVLAAMMDHPTLAVAAIRSGRLRQANASWNALFGTRDEAPQEPSISSLFGGARSAERFERLLRSEFDKGVARVEHLLTRADGSSFMAEIVVHLLADENSLDADAVWQVRDITAERELRRELREMEEYYRALSTYQWDLTFVLDRDFYVSYASPSVETVLGYRASELLGERVDRYLHRDQVEAGLALFGRVLAGDAAAQRDSFRVHIRHRDGSYRVLSCRQRNCLDVARIAGIVVNARDITQEVIAERARDRDLSYSTQLRTALFELSTAPWVDFSERLERLLRSALDELRIHSASFWRYDKAYLKFHCEHAVLANGDVAVADPMREILTEETFPLYVREIHSHKPIVVPDVRDHPAVSATHLQRLRRAKVGAMLDFPVSRDGETLGVMSLEFGGAPRAWQSDEISFAGGLSLLIALAFESAERAAAAARSEYMAMHDSLTGLANRNRAEREIRQAIAQAGKHRQKVALLLIDLDEFKEINDTFGHGRGDILLAKVAQVLIECAGPEALVARMGGDEFLILIRNAEPGQAEPLGQRIVDRLSTEHLLPGIEQNIGASIGVALFPVDGTDPETLLANADIAMYQAKERGRNQVFAFNAKLAQRLKLQRDLDLEIRDALKQRQFSLFYQPQIDLASGRVIGLEALLRWEHPKRGLLLPSTFMAAAEHNGLIDTITKWALNEVCEQNMAWQDAGIESIPISVNVTGRQFLDPHLPALIAGALMRSGMAARNLVLEVTEESLIENTKTTERVLAELKRLGVRIAIDDFGVGYSSLSYLRRLVVSQIKLDKAFIEGLPEDTESGAIVAAVIAIAKRLKYQVIAEGIETQAQADHLLAIGCEAGQGFHFGAPLSVSEIADFLMERAARA